MYPIKALCFDLDQTLLDNRHFGKSIQGTCDALAERVPALKAVDLVQANQAAFSELGPVLMDDWMLGRLSGRDLVLEAWRRTLLERGQTEPSLVRFAAHTHWHLMQQIYQLFDDTAEVIRALRQQQIPLGLITNGASDTQREKLEATGLIDCFDVIVISAEVGIAKPSAVIFQHAIEHLEIEGKSVWHVGDNINADVAGAQAAGLTGVWLNRNAACAPAGIIPDLEIGRLTDLCGYLGGE